MELFGRGLFRRNPAFNFTRLGGGAQWAGLSSWSTAKASVVFLDLSCQNEIDTIMYTGRGGGDVWSIITLIRKEE